MITKAQTNVVSSFYQVLHLSFFVFLHILSLSCFHFSVPPHSFQVFITFFSFCVVLLSFSFRFSLSIIASLSSIRFLSIWFFVTGNCQKKRKSTLLITVLQLSNQLRNNFFYQRSVFSSKEDGYRVSYICS